MRNNKKENLITNENKKTDLVERIIFWLLFATLVGTMAFIIVAICLGSKWSVNGTQGKGIWSNVGDLILTSIALILLFAPSFIERKFKVKIPSFIYILFIVFLFLSIYLGHVRSLYKKLPSYDTFVHFFSSVVLGLASISILKLVDDNGIPIKPWFILVFAISFTIAVGVFWEIWEFFRDACTGSNMQRFKDVNTGEMFIGQAALFDTMKDLIVDGCGAVVAGIIGSLTVRINPKNFNKLTIYFNKREKEEVKKEGNKKANLKPKRSSKRLHN